MSTKIAGWNVNSLNVRLPHVLDYLSEATPDILGLQELKQTDEAVKREAFEAAGWYIITHGQKTYNGVALISKIEPKDIQIGIPGNEDDPQARAIAASYGDIRVLNLYVPNGKSVGDEKYQYKLAWLKKLIQYVKQTLTIHSKLVIIGDFNIAPADIDVHDPEAWRDKILCSPPERAALQALLDLGLTDAYRHIHPDTQHFSWWDYRMGGLRRNLGLRIDLTLTSSALTITDAGIDIEPRKRERPSDHTPVWVTV
ncbi:exodeoxyribonuclease III [Suttonella ornithocola]|uniref:Exodeoxyribonuclease III n=1 Tax=Suttonella ornithocola TaxID=279832 RepID=A0A380MQL2_9GAMM|nr:exodeoxyribonuclease III [Suttonella ornithocola]SUO94592.1 Exodeoxyribonuclease III [Suttonella ornithocola]